MARYYLHCNAALLFVLVLTLSCEPLTGQDKKGYGGKCPMSICITNDEVGCHQPVNVTTSITGSSQLLRDLSLNCVTVYFTSGTHLLENTIIFPQNITNIEIIGTVMPQTMIECGLSDSLDFYSRSGGIFISNVIFEKCLKWRDAKEEHGQLQVALYFQNFNLTIENVTVQNSGCGILGILVYQCVEVVMRNCKFYNNTNGHVRILAYSSTSVSIYQSLFYNGSSRVGGGLKITRSVTGMVENPMFVINVVDCVFKQNTAHNGSHFYIMHHYNFLYHNENTRVLITGCVFTESAVHKSSVNSFGIFIATSLGLFGPVNTPVNTLNVNISRSIINNSKSGGIFIRNANGVVIDQCNVMANRGKGIQIIKTFLLDARAAEVSPVISQTEFHDNTKALDIGIAVSEISDRHRKRRQMNIFRKVLVKNCTFTGHFNLNSVVSIYDAQDHNSMKLYFRYITIHIENCQFENNILNAGKSNSTKHCSVLHLKRVYVTTDNLSFTDNSCTGLILNSSILIVQNLLNFTRNYAEFDGALHLSYYIPGEKSKIIIKPHAKLFFFYNQATEYGGGIYTDETCEDANKYCFFQLELVQTSSPTFYFVGNSADKGGNSIFGGCLSNCSMGSGEMIDIRKNDSIFWKITMLSPDDKMSQSNFADYPNKVVFCENISTSDVTCKDTHQVTVYRGGTFTVQMMAVGHLCSPSYNIIRAEVPPGIGKGVHIGRGEDYKPATIYCDRYTYSMRGGQSNDSNFTIYITLTLQESRSITNIPPTQLIVDYLNQCPLGFWLDKKGDKCLCSALLESNGVQCTDDYSFDVPALTWVGIWQGKVAVGSYCQHCKTSGVHNIKNTSSSDSLCALNRTGLLCGECIKGCSIQLGGYKCGNCLKSNYVGALLTVAFAIVGFLLVVVLLKLNLTISTGLINGLILYANIVYSNHSIFLPFDREMEIAQSQLNNVVHFLYIFQAWLNLDFGFDICYFHGTDTFIVTWLQFVFPLYIWIIIFILVVVSRYSTRVSKFTGYNTISVLATLLQMSYTKLLLAVFLALSYTRLDLIGGRKSYPLWSSDANIRYVVSKHVTLFLMSIFMIFAYILPFTSFIALGPILISKSNYKVLRWVHKIKPFLDAFYGPYTKIYGYWPGILLIMRVILTSIIAFYSAGDDSFVLVTISVSLPFLFLLWLLIGRTHKVSLHRRKKLNLLELFFLLNLSLFSIISLYLNLKHSKNLHKQQVLAVVMVGSVFITFCCIMAYCIFCAARSWPITRKLICFIPAGIRMRREQVKKAIQQEESSDDSIGTYHNTKGNRQPATQTTLDIPELREPLLEVSS